MRPGNLTPEYCIVKLGRRSHSAGHCSGWRHVILFVLVAFQAVKKSRAKDAD